MKYDYSLISKRCYRRVCGVSRSYVAGLSLSLSPLCSAEPSDFTCHAAAPCGTLPLCSGRAVSAPYRHLCGGAVAAHDHAEHPSLLESTNPCRPTAVHIGALVHFSLQSSRLNICYTTKICIRGCLFHVVAPFGTRPLSDLSGRTFRHSA